MLRGCVVNPLTIDENEHADLSAGYYLHGIPFDSSAEEIELRRQYGLCCSEYLGVPESAKECSFCLSVTKTKNLESNSVVDKRYLIDGNGKETGFDEMCMSVVPEVGFIIDKSITHRTDGNRQLNYFDYKK